jgi:hypothetical protein
MTSSQDTGSVLILSQLNSVYARLFYFLKHNLNRLSTVCFIQLLQTKFVTLLYFIRKWYNRRYLRLLDLTNFFHKSAVFWDIMRRRVVIFYRRFGTTYRSHPHGSRVRVGEPEIKVFFTNLFQLSPLDRSFPFYYT